MLAPLEQARAARCPTNPRTAAAHTPIPRWSEDSITGTWAHRTDELRVGAVAPVRLGDVAIAACGTPGEPVHPIGRGGPVTGSDRRVHRHDGIREPIRKGDIGQGRAVALRRHVMYVTGRPMTAARSAAARGMLMAAGPITTTIDPGPVALVNAAAAAAAMFRTSMNAAGQSPIMPYQRPSPRTVQPAAPARHRSLVT